MIVKTFCSCLSRKIFKKKNFFSFTPFIRVLVYTLFPSLYTLPFRYILYRLYIFWWSTCISFPLGWQSWHSGGHCPCACASVPVSLIYLYELNKYFLGGSLSSSWAFSQLHIIHSIIMRMDLSHDFSGSTRRNIMRWCNDQMKTNKSTLNGIAFFLSRFFTIFRPIPCY